MAPCVVVFGWREASCRTKETDVLAFTDASLSMRAARAVFAATGSKAEPNTTLRMLGLESQGQNIAVIFEAQCALVPGFT
eukprot:2036223-Pleurochrysis_carterae.AAC.2